MASSTVAPTRSNPPRSNSKRKQSLDVDTIQVKGKSSRAPPIIISDNTDDDSPRRVMTRISTTGAPGTGGSNRLWDRKGKASAQSDQGDFGSQDEVEEYDFSMEVEEDLEEGDASVDSIEAEENIVEISSDDEESKEGFADRPWLDFDDKMREQWEVMYATVTTHPIGNSWEITEEYQKEKDAEMLRYMEDFPLQRWIVPQDQANQAYFRLLERSRWRSLGIRIYGRERIPEWIPDSADAARLQQALNIPREKYLREPALQPQPTYAQTGPSAQPSPALHQQQPQHHPQQLPPQLRTQHCPSSATTHQHHSPASNTNAHGPQLVGAPPQGHTQVLPHHNSALPHHGPRPTQAQMLARGPPAPPPQQRYPLPPPQISVPSQPHAQPMAVHPGQPGHPQYAHPGMGRPVGPPQQMAYVIPQPYGGNMTSPTNFPHVEHPKPMRPRAKKESPIATTPPPPPPTPPYELRQKPKERVGKNAPRKGARRQAEAEEFPWTRQIDFAAEKAQATWDDSVYDPVALREMVATRLRNVAIIDELDAKVQEQQRIARANKKKRGQDPSSDVEAPPAPGEKKKMQRGQRKGESGGDPYHSGAFAFASGEDTAKAHELGFQVPDEAIEAAELGKLDVEGQASLKICWNPGKKGTTENLEQVKFSVKDTVVTRKQLKERLVLTKRAAECIVDFCPDLLWRGMLLRITSEAGYGNKDVRDRFCYNGCYCDKATITKRISAALGQKQVQPKSKGYGPGEWEWYDENVKDFSKYIDYFGKRHSHRNMLKIQMQGEKRKMAAKQVLYAGTPKKGDSLSSSAEDEAAPSRKRQRLDKSGNAGEESEDDNAEDEINGVDDGHESDASDDVVSLQDSDILDELDD
ncbi:hypothetical protein DOTSEDRAFT_49600 [Dothistroma septosporum NZE10]|uniref:Uncharacterized protein n=1 Tax=Dothistroma septosporum (strain NZE10 / CBS 128990) TaxID=675120 RepID=N1Q3R6_DOTSN|nr:hypothetical protein DOTSEDRAFT_49600 [Dothistroma septosporum NZE10]